LPQRGEKENHPMAVLKTTMDIFQLLDRSNCRQCGKKTCLAFAGAVFQGQKELSDCPKIDPKVLDRLSLQPASDPIEEGQEDYLAKLRSKMAKLDLEAAAGRTGGRLSAGRLTIKVLGKDFSVDREGNLFSDIHVNPWVAMPFFDYVIYGEGLPVSGDWVSLRDLKDGAERYPLFRKRCEDEMKRVADRHTEFFDDIVQLFNGRQVEEQFASDISVVLHPFPKVPIMICYWKPEGDLASSLHVFFDKTADRNLGIGAVFSLATGLTQMFEKLSRRHGFSQPEGHV
jgi:hypothetical protein